MAPLNVWHRLGQVVLALLLCLVAPPSFPLSSSPHTPLLQGVGAQQQQQQEQAVCPPRPMPPPPSSGSHGALGPFISSAASTRQGILMKSVFPYDRIRDEIREQ